MRSIVLGRYVFHLLFWIMYAVFMILEVQGYIREKGFVFALLPLAIYFALMAFLVYGNTLVLIPLLLEKRKVGLYVGGITLVIVLYASLRSLNQQYWDTIVWPKDVMHLSDYVHWGFLYAIWFLIISSMLFFTQKWSEQRQQVKNSQISQLQTELKYLRAQINPHFLFNGLNTIYGNIDIKDQKARDILLLFADLLRYNLYEADVDWVTLDKEADYLQNYVALQRARSNETVEVSLTTVVTDKTVKIAPLLFIPFVENAFKYSARVENSINPIEIRLQQLENRLVFECRNPFEEPAPEPGGIGLSNVKRRLELLYKDQYTLTIQHEQQTWTVFLSLTL